MDTDSESLLQTGAPNSSDAPATSGGGGATHTRLSQHWQAAYDAAERDSILADRWRDRVAAAASAQSAVLEAPQEPERRHQLEPSAEAERQEHRDHTLQVRPGLLRGQTTLLATQALRGFKLRLRDPPVAGEAARELRSMRGFFERKEVEGAKGLFSYYLKMDRFSNRFITSATVEDRYHRYVTEFQLHRVRVRLGLCALVLFLNGVYLFAVEGVAPVWAAWQMGVPAAVLAGAALLLWDAGGAKEEIAGTGSPSAAPACAPCGAEEAGVAATVAPPGPLACPLGCFRRWWRLVVMIASFVAYTIVLFADALLERNTQKEVRHTAREVAWQLCFFQLAAAAAVLNSALDFALVAVLVPALWLCFCARLVCDLPWIEGVLSEREEGLEEAERHRLRHDVFKAALAGWVSVVLLLMGAKRANNFDRESFAQQYQLWVQHREYLELCHGECTEVFAIFSNPREVRHEMSAAGDGGGHAYGGRCKERERGSPPPRLPQLRLGPEMRFLIENIPAWYLHMEPAATLEATAKALAYHRPRIVMFCGHSAQDGVPLFEEDEGIPGSQQRPEIGPEFIDMLRRSYLHGNRRMEAVFLNSCNSMEFGKEILLALRDLLPQLKIICWNGLVADKAARAFSFGFMQHVGESLKCNGLREEKRRTTIKDAFWAGCWRFWQEGCIEGDPATSKILPCQPQHGELHGKAPRHNGPGGRAQGRTGLKVCKVYRRVVHGKYVLLGLDSKGEVEELGFLPQKESQDDTDVVLKHRHVLHPSWTKAKVVKAVAAISKVAAPLPGGGGGAGRHDGKWLNGQPGS